MRASARRLRPVSRSRHRSWALGVGAPGAARLARVDRGDRPARAHRKIDLDGRDDHGGTLVTTACFGKGPAKWVNPLVTVCMVFVVVTTAIGCGSSSATKDAEASATPGMPAGFFLPWTGQVAEEQRSRTPAIRGAPWIYQPTGSPVITRVARRPSLRFPPGTSYTDALFDLYVAATLHGTLPAAGRLGPPLPVGVVLLDPHDPAVGISIDLTAPFGYDPERRVVLPPLFELPPDLQTQVDFDRLQLEMSRDRLVWPRGAVFRAPRLPDCMVIHGPRERRELCNVSTGRRFLSSDPATPARPLPTAHIAP